MQRLGIQLFTGATFIVGWLLSLSGSSFVGLPMDENATICAVSDAEQGAIRSLMEIAGTASDRSCAFNMTLQSLLSSP